MNINTALPMTAQISFRPPAAPPSQPPVLNRNANPLSHMQRDQMQQLGAPGPHDNSSAQDVRASYRQASQQVEHEADTFTSQGTQLESQGKDLEALARQLGNGSHTGPYGEVQVTLRSDGISATQHQGQTQRSLDHAGDHLVVQNGSQRLEDTPDARTIQDGQTTRTLHLQDSFPHHAGEFEVESNQGSEHDLTRVQGPSIQHDHESGQSDSESSKWDAPQGGGVSFSNNRTRFNRTNRQTSTNFREVQVGSDGSAQVRQNDANDQVTTRTEPAQK